ncbi:hypothetical protein JCM6882_004623 [Rhodosporidiobolus microsporus]
MASARLKRTLERAADEGQYGNLAESFVSVGTALPALTDNKKDKNEFKPQWEQEVYDEQGRRRFHGAFTGGFSAGYFNSVGSKEGWTPSTFKSSRGNRAAQSGQNVADAAKAFMDAEDLAELASSRTLETSSAYASRSAAAPPPKQADYDPLLGHFGSLAPTPAAAGASDFDASLASLIQPSSSRVGLKLMRKMGWRDGQGVGPRMTFAQRKKQAAEIGVSLGTEGEEEEESDEAKKHLYAPLDRPLTLVKGTSASADRGWGLGYRPGMTLEARLKGEGTGAGGGMRSRFEVDEDEDEDEDPYGGGAGPRGLGERERRALGAYDAMGEGEGEDDEGLDRMKRSSGSDREKPPPKRSAAGTQEFVDGTRLLSGFVLQTEPVAGPSTSKLPPPPPAGWEPNPSRLWKENEPPAASTSDVKGKGRQLDAEERGSLLGEKAPPPPPAVPRSVFDYLSAKSRERLATVTSTGGAPPPPASAMTGANAIPVGGGGRGASAAAAAATPSAPPPPPEPEVELFVPTLDRPTALAALRGFQPYSSASTSPDPVKQARYTLYLQYQSSGTASSTSSPFGPRTLPNGKTQTVEELNRELSEYAQAARVFKPVGGMLGSRFQTSQTGSLDVPKVAPGLWQPPPKSASASSSSSTDPLLAAYGDASSAPSAPLKPPEPALTPAQQAARAGNFGPGTTRTVSQFRPARLVCKRFGVRDPYEVREGGEGGDEGVGGKWGEASASGFGGPGAGAAGGGAQQPVGQAALEEMMNSAGFKRFQMAAEEEAQVGEDSAEVAKGVFETPAAAFASSAGDGAGVKKPAAHRPKPTIETVGLGDDEAQGEEIVEEKKAPADIFAAIFADSDDDDDEDEDEEDAAGGTHPAEAAEAATVLSVDQVDPYAPKPSTAMAADEPAIPLTLDTVGSYRPSFVASSSRSAAAAEPSSTSASTSTSKTALKKDKKSKSKRKAGALSFDVEDGGGEGQDEERSTSKKKARREREKERDRDGRERSREKEKKRERSRSRERELTSGREEKRSRSFAPPAAAAAGAAADDDDEWGEAAPEVHPSILASMQQPGGEVAGEGKKREEDGAAGAKKGRMRAADLY